MDRIGHYVIALAPGADPEKFKAHLTNALFKDPSVMASTRITRGFAHRLLAVAGGHDGMPAKYVWQVTADLMGNGNYEFAQNAAKVQAGIRDFGVLTEVVDLIDLEAGKLH
ncbi:MAG: hypothetical protein AB7P52_14905 [Alphaproteobacteria bacterium]